MLEYADISGNGKGVGFTRRTRMSDTLTAAGASDPAECLGDFNVSLGGTFIANIALERSYDRGLNWSPITALGTRILFTAPCEEIFTENEPGVMYRLNCTSYTSGSINCRISQ